jgi:hypothetical protein
VLTLQVTIPVDNLDSTNESATSVFTLELEHSLVSLSKWESIYEKPFLSDGDKTLEETLKYIELMILNRDVPADILSKLSNEHIESVNAYITSKQTATTFHEAVSGAGGPSASEIITAEIMYYWLVTLNIPFECQHWHLNRLISLVRVCNLKNQPPKKMGRQEMIAERKRINAERQAKHQTRG